jgi:hypothetical protein
MGRKRIVYAPLPLLTAVVLIPVATLVAVTVAPTTTAPLGSVTSPVIEPVTVCPSAEAAHSKASRQHPNRARSEFALIIPLCVSSDFDLAKLVEQRL